MKRKTNTMNHLFRKFAPKLLTYRLTSPRDNIASKINEQGGPSRTQHPAHFGQSLYGFAKVLEGCTADDEVEAPTLQRQGRRIAHLELRSAG